MQKKYQNKGMILIALSDEPKSKVAPYLDKHKIPYVVGDGAGKTQEAYGIDGFPTAFLIDPEGKIAWKGHPASVEGEITKLLKDKPPKKGGLFSEKSAQAAFKKADRYFKDKRYPEAMDAFKGITSTYKGTKVAKQAKQRISTMKGNSSIMDALKRHEAEAKSKAWLEIARTCLAYGEKQEALKYYNKIIDTYGEYETAKVARQEKASLGDVKAESDDGAKTAKKQKKGKAKEDEEEEEDSSDEEEEEDSEDEEEEEDSGG